MYLNSDWVQQIRVISEELKNQLNVTYYLIVLFIGSTCFGHYYAHHQELATIMFITTLVVSLCKDGGVSISVNVWFLVVCVRCEFLCRLVVSGNEFLLLLIQGPAEIPDDVATQL